MALRSPSCEYSLTSFSGCRVPDVHANTGVSRVFSKLPPTPVPLIQVLEAVASVSANTPLLAGNTIFVHPTLSKQLQDNFRTTRMLHSVTGINNLLLKQAAVNTNRSREKIIPAAVGLPVTPDYRLLHAGRAVSPTLHLTLLGPADVVTAETMLTPA
jgi:hypothetical protein